MNFIEKLLSCRDKSTLIEKFQLSSSEPNCCLDIDSVNDCIRDVVLKHGVRELDLNIQHCKVQFCSSFFVSCKSLTSLKLSFNPHSDKSFPAFFSFPNLKTMNLKNVILRTHFASQLINCPKLENLVIDSCTFDDDKKDPIPYDECTLKTLPNLLNVSISVTVFWEKYIGDIVRLISNVEVLSLRIKCPKQLHEQLPKMGYFSKFSNLKVLEFGEIYEIKIGVGFMDGMLRSLPVLEYLNIGCIYYMGLYEDGSGVPNCPISERLKVVKIGKIFREKMIIIIKIVKYFLEGAKGLEKMIVSMPMSLNQEDLDFFYESLQALPNIGALKLRD